MWGAPRELPVTKLRKVSDGKIHCIVSDDSVPPPAPTPTTPRLSLSGDKSRIDIPSTCGRNFSEVSAQVHLIYQVPEENNFENVYLGVRPGEREKEQRHQDVAATSPRPTFSKVSALVCLPYKVNTWRTLQNFRLELLFCSSRSTQAQT